MSVGKLEKSDITPVAEDITKARRVLENDGGADRNYAATAWWNEGGWKAAACFSIIGTIYIALDAVYTRLFTSVAEGFNKDLKVFTNLQTELGAADVAGQFPGMAITMKQGKELLAQKAQSERVIGNLAGRVVALSSMKDVDSKAAKARIEAAKELMRERLEAANIDGARVDTAIEKFEESVRERAVRSLVSSVKIATLSGDIASKIEERAKEMVEKGWFANEDEATEAMKDALAVLVKKAGDKVVEDRIEALTDFSGNMEAAIDVRIKAEVEKYKKLEADRNKLYNPETPDDASKQFKADKDYDGEFVNGGKLYTLDKAYRDAMKALEKFDERFDKLDGVDVAAVRADFEAGKRNGSYKGKLKRIADLLDQEAAAVKKAEDAKKALNKAKKEYNELADKLDKLKETLGDDPVKYPDRGLMEDRITADNTATIDLLKELQGRTVKKKSSSLKTEEVDDQLRAIAEARAAVRTITETRASTRASVVDAEIGVRYLSKEQEDALRAVDGLLTRVARQNSFDNSDEVIDRLMHSGHLPTVRKLKADILFILSRMENKLNKLDK